MDKKTHKNHDLTDNKLRQLYCVDGKSDREIGLLFGLSDAAVGYFRKKYGISTIKAENRVSLLNQENRIDQVDPKRLGELYRQYSLSEIGQQFGCSKVLIKRKLIDSGILILSKHERHLKDYPSFLSGLQMELLLGSLLGDGMMIAQGVSGKYREYHCDAQLPYIEWKSKLLSPFSFGLRRKSSLLADGRKAWGWELSTCWHPVFLDLERRFYHDRKKIVPDGLIESLTPLSLAVWYMDDGCLVGGRDYTIAISFAEDELSRIVEVLNVRFGFDCHYKKVENIFILSFDNGNRFVDVIGSHILPCFYYKVRLEHRFSLPNINRLDLSKFNPNNTTLQSVEQARDYWRIRGFPYPLFRKAERIKEEEELKNSQLILNEEIAQGHNEGSGLCLSFFKNIWYAKKYGKRSAMEVFLNDTLLLDCVKDSVCHRGSASAANLRAELQTWGGVHNFRPAIAKAICERYCPGGGSVLDPCAGWGGRLFGFYCNQVVRRYVGIDASANTVRGLKHMLCILGRDFPDKVAEIHYSAFEDWNTNERFDLVFTSPPYFNKEWYDSDDHQSSSRYPIYSQWHDKFLLPLIKKSFSLLKENGILVLNVADVMIGRKQIPVASDALMMAKDWFVLKNTHMMNYRTVYTRKHKQEPIFVFSKKSEIS